MASVAPRRDDLLSVQALRAIAALLVVAYHALDAWARHYAGQTADALWGNGSSGVDIFFVISGVVMTISAQRVVGKPGPAWAFMRARLTRILPLYWVATTAKIVLVLALPTLALQTRLSPGYVAGSYALLPVHDWAGAFKPVLPVGWTLTYEMLFYLLVATALALRVPILRIALPALVLVAASAPLLPQFGNTIVLEFLYGVGIGLAWQSGRLRLAAAVPLATCLLVGGGIAILVMPVTSGILRPLTWGVPAACIVAGAVMLEQPLRRLLPRWLLASGDASYAVYLLHGFVIPAVALAAAHARLAPIPALVLTVAASLLLSALIGHVAHVWLEQPMLRWFRGRRAAPSVAVAA